MPACWPLLSSATARGGSAAWSNVDVQTNLIRDDGAVIGERDGACAAAAVVRSLSLGHDVLRTRSQIDDDQRPLRSTAVFRFIRVLAEALRRPESECLPIGRERRVSHARAIGKVLRFLRG